MLLLYVRFLFTHSETSLIRHSMGPENNVGLGGCWIMECLLPYLCMVTVPHIMVGLERMLDYRGVGLERFHCTWYQVPDTWYLIPDTRYLIPDTWYLIYYVYEHDYTLHITQLRISSAMTGEYLSYRLLSSFDAALPRGWLEPKYWL